MFKVKVVFGENYNTAGIATFVVWVTGILFKIWFTIQVVDYGSVKKWMLARPTNLDFIEILSCCIGE